MKTFLRRAAIVIGGWAVSLILGVLSGYFMARHSVGLQALTEGSANGGHFNTARYGNLFAIIDREMLILGWVLYPCYFAGLGLFTGFFEKTRPLLTAALVILPAFAFISMSMWFDKRVLVLAPTYLLVASAASCLTFSWRKRRNISTN